MTDERSIKTGTGSFESIPAGEFELTNYQEMLENLVYAGIGAPIYKDVVGDTQLNIQREVGTEKTSFHSHTPKSRTIYGVILPTRTNTMEDAEFLILGNDQTAMLVNVNQNNPNEFTFAILQPEGRGIELTNIPNNQGNIALSAYDIIDIYYKVSATAEHDPDKIIAKTKEALAFAEASLIERRTNSRYSCASRCAFDRA